MDDFLDEKGILICGKCGGEKETEFYGMMMPCACECMEAEDKEQEQREWEEQQQTWIDSMCGAIPEAFRSCTFANDDGKNKQATMVCRRYAENWSQMAQENIGVLLYGPVGTGKTFYACAIAREVIQQTMKPVYITSVGNLITKLQDFDKQSEALDRITNRHLMVLDDLGTERKTDYGYEKLHQIIDSRYASGKPLIVTTNLDLADMQNEQGDYKRIYDRILEMCPIQLKVGGESRRPENAEKRKQLAKQIMEGKHG